MKYKIGDWVIVKSKYNDITEICLIIGLNAHFTYYVVLSYKESKVFQGNTPHILNANNIKTEYSSYNIEPAHYDRYVWIINDYNIIKQTTKPKCKICKLEL